MKKFIFLILCWFALSGSVLSQDYNWEWAKMFAGDGDDGMRGIAIDDEGNIYFCGNTTSSSIEIGGYLLENNGEQDFFIGKCDNNGNILWAKIYGGTKIDACNKGLTLDSENNVIVAGYFRSPVIHFDMYNVNGAGDYDMFVVKLDTDGNEKWVRAFGSSGEDLIHNVTADDDDNIYITGNFDSQIVTLNTQHLANPYPGYDEIFIAKLNQFGNAQWTVTAVGDNDDRCYRIVIDDDDNIIVSGGFGSSSISFDNNVLINSGSYDPFIAKYDINGNFLWAKSAYGDEADYGYSICTDNENSIYQSGYFRSAILIADGKSMNNVDGEDIFLIKYDSQGTVEWAKSYGSSFNDRPRDISFSNNETLILSGYYGEPYMHIDTISLFSKGFEDVFIMELDKDASLYNVSSIGSILSDVGFFVANLGSEMYVAGEHQSNVDFGDNTLTNDYNGLYGGSIAKCTNVGYPNVFFTYETDSLTLLFNNQSFHCDSYYWDFGDGNTSEEENPTHTYMDFGEYEVSLIGFNNNGSDTMSQSIPVFSFFEIVLQPGPNEGKDAVIYSLYPGNNYGNGENIQASAWTYDDIFTFKRGLLDFNLDTLPDSCEIISATLSLYAPYDDPNEEWHSSYSGPNTSVLDMITETWEESTVSWSTQPASSEENQVILSPTVVPLKNYTDIDVTEMISYKHKKPDNCFGFFFKLVTEDYYRRMSFATSDHPDSTIRPKLVIKVATLPDLSFETSVEDLTLNCVNKSQYANHYLWDFGDGTTSDEINPQHTYNQYSDYLVKLIGYNNFGSDTLSDSISLIPIETIILQPDGIDGKDAILMDYYAESNFGNYEAFRSQAWTTGGDPYLQRSLIDFDLSIIPSGSEILEASLSLYARYDDPYGNHSSLTGPNTSYLHKVIEPWQEYTVTWNNQPDYDDTMKAILPPTDIPLLDYNDINVTNLIIDKYENPESNFGMLLKLDTEEYYRRLCFASSDHLDPEIRPKLKIKLLNQTEPPVADFSFELGDKIIQFINNSLFDETWYWDFGDGATSNTKDPEHVYNEYGIYTVVLTVNNGNGSDSFEQVIDVCEPAIAHFTFEAIDSTVYFYNQSINSSSYFWDFNDGYISTLENPSHQFLEAGIHTVVLTSSNSCNSNTFDTTFSLCYRPYTVFDYSQSRDSILFTNLTQNFNSCLWDFGDGYGSNLNNPIHIYPAYGNYIVTLITENQCGPDTLSKNIEIFDPPVANFSYQVENLTTVYFYNHSNYGLDYHWDFGDSTWSDEMEPVHIYSELGEYDVVLTVTNPYGSHNMEMPVQLTSITDLEQTDCMVYPVPATNQLNINCAWFNGNDCVIEMYSLFGIKVMETNIDNVPSNIIQIKIPDYIKQGTYILKVSDNMDIFHKKILIK